MRSRQLVLSTALALAALVAALPGFAYVAGLAKAHGRPEPASPAHYSSEAVAAAWARCDEQLPLATQQLSPWGYAGRLLFGNALRAAPGERAAWRIAATHNVRHPVGGSFWWHMSGAALTIWLTRHWSAEQIGATLARDNLCR
jgi:hypothetical protein